MTVCSGIGAPEYAAPWIDWRWQSEIEPFPCSVLRHRFPDAVNLGDMTKFKEWPDATVDVLCGGTPCQSFSVAGLRKGLADPRGNLMLTYLAIADRFRPRWIVWENVPGVLSSNGGRDFGSFLGGLGQLGYGFAYRVLDAQFVRSRRYPRAVPQRRRRVFVVGYLGDWRRAAAVLFDAQSMSGHPPPRRESGKGIARGFEIGPSGGSFTDLSPTLDARCKDGPIRNQIGAGVIASTGEVSHCLNAGGMGRIDYESETMIAHALRGEGFDASEDGTGRGTPLVPVAFQSKASATNSMNPSVVAPTLDKGKAEGMAVALPWAVRRLMPREAERLQGFSPVIQCVRINVWSGGRLPEHVNAEARCTIGPGSVLPVGGGASSQIVRPAGHPSPTLLPDQDPPVVVRVQINYGRKEVLISNQERFLWSASFAEGQNSFHQHMPLADFVRLVALLKETAARRTPNGRAVSPRSTTHSTTPGNGSWCVSVFGEEIGDVAGDADSATRLINSCTKSTTSRSGLSSQNLERTLITSSCCVAAAIISFIQMPMPIGSSFAVEIETEQDWTDVPHRGKPAADGPRYKALGNSWAVNCGEWIFDRIREVESRTFPGLADAAADQWAEEARMGNA